MALQYASSMDYFYKNLRDLYASSYGEHHSDHSGSGIDRSSGHGHHSDGGHRHSGGGNGHSGGYFEHSGHSGGGYGHKDQCCPLVFDALCFAVILSSIAGASVLLSRVIQIEIMAGRRKRSLPYKSCLLEGKLRAFHI